MKKFRGLTCVLIVMLLLNSIAFGEITDVTEDDWSEPYIRKVVETDVMPTEDGIFNPSAKVTKMEVLNVIYRVALLKGDITTEGVDALLEKYQATIDGLLIPNVLDVYGAENHRAIAYALEKGIVRSSELSLFYINGAFEAISKVDTSVYIGKALNVYLKENVNKFYEIRYKDGGEITLMAWPYVNLLIEKEIVSKDGNEGYYYPNSIMRRDVLSVFVSGMLRELENYDASAPETPTVTTKADGKISIIHYDKNIIEIRDSYNNLTVYDAVDAEITLNGEVVAIQNLEPGVDVNIEANGNKLVKVTVVQEFDTKSGTVATIGNTTTIKGETFRPFAIETSKIEYFKVYNSVVVERDYQSVSIDDLKRGDTVTIYYQDMYAKKIVAFSDRIVLDGALQRSTQFNVGDAVSIKLSNGKLLEQVLEQSVVKTGVTGDLTKGDIVKVTLSNGVITAVEATGLSTEADGRVTEILIGTSSKIKIVTNKGTTKSYNIAKDVVVKNLGTIDTSGLYALRLDQEVHMELSGVTVDLISIEKAVEKTQFQAEITEIHKNINLIKAKDQNDKTWIVSLEGSDQNIEDYTVGDDVFIYGVELSGDLFEADLIIILE